MPRGKGAFYCFIGLLAFIALQWSLARICVFIVFIVGVAYLLNFGGSATVEPTPAPGASGEQRSGLVGNDSAGISSSSVAASFSEFAVQVAKENPDVLKAGVDYAARNPEATSKIAAGFGDP